MRILSLSEEKQNMSGWERAEGVGGGGENEREKGAETVVRI